MTRVLAMAALTILLICSATPAYTQPVPDTLRSAGVTQAQWDAIRREARAQAQRARISEASLIAAAEGASVNLSRSGRFDAASLQQTIFDTLAEQADQIADLRRRLDALTGDRDAAAAARFAEARAALEQGRLADADRLLAQSAAGDLATLQQADAEVERRRLRAGETIASRAQIAFVQADYATAVQHFARAAETVPQSAIEARWRYRSGQANSAFTRGYHFTEPDALREALQTYEQQVLPLAQRAARPADWAATQHAIGLVLRVQGSRGEGSALDRAVAAYEAALAVRTRTGDPANWADTQYELGLALVLRYGGGARPADLARAAASFEAALTVRTRQADPVGWAETQSALGDVLILQRERERAVALYRDVLTVQTPDADPIGWADTQLGLGTVLGQLNRSSEQLAAVEAALTVFTREAYPHGWATAQNNLASAYFQLGDPQRAAAALEAALTVMTPEANPAAWALVQGNLGGVYASIGTPQALERAVEHFQAALTARPRERDPAGWASTSFALANAYYALGRHQEARAAGEAALSGYEQVGAVDSAIAARTFLSWLPADPARGPDTAARPGRTFRDCDQCPEMVELPAGRFTMDQRQVSVAAFAAGRYEVTRGQFAAFVRATGRTPANNCFTDRDNNGSWEQDANGTWRDPGFAQTDDHPVVCVSWDDAQAYVAWLNAQTRGGYRLLSEAEWEYAARAASTSVYPWGATASRDNANYGLDACCRGFASGRDRWVNTAPVGQFPANGFGLSDTSGNVQEWTGDCREASGQMCTLRAIRGGGWGSTPQALRPADRSWNGPAIRGSDLGFRVARTLN
ncbi:MAG: SUMF1/EgtB/PvdO family nonheme iron enzyme [Hyphomonadaceae bacterium]